MSDWLPETANLARSCCPGCEPDADPLAEILQIDYCALHRPSLAGSDDDRVEAPIGILGSSDTDGETQRQFARLLRAG
jgi:hypothetical protein